MRWLFLALLAISLPALVVYANNGAKHRDRLLVLIGVLFFVTGSIALDAAIITWPTWPGTSRGIILSFVDIIAVALILTQKKRSKKTPFLIVSFLFLIPMLIASLLAPVKMAAAFVVIQFVQMIILFYALNSELNRPSAIPSLLKGVAIGLIIQAGYVVQQKATGVVQATGTVFHQNVLGMMAQFAAAPLLAAIMEGQRSKLIYAGVIAACICVAGGGSRASMAFFAVALALTIVVSLSRRATARKWKIVGMGVVVSALFVPLALGTLKDRFGTLEISAEDQSRMAFERAAVAIAADYPLGVGPNNFVSINNTGGYAATAGIEWGGGLLDKPVHNAYLLARSETGWFGQLTLLLLQCAVAWAALSTAFRERRSPAVGIAAGSAAAVTSVAIHSNWEFAWYVMEVQRLFFVNAAIVGGCMAIAADAKMQNRNARRIQGAVQRDDLADKPAPVPGQGVSYGN